METVSMSTNFPQDYLLGASAATGVFKAISTDLLASQSVAVRRAGSLLVSAFAVLALTLACVAPIQCDGLRSHREPVHSGSLLS